MKNDPEDSLSTFAWLEQAEALSKSLANESCEITEKSIRERVFRNGTEREYDSLWQELGVVDVSQLLNAIQKVGEQLKDKKHRSFSLALLDIASNESKSMEIREAALVSFFQVSARPTSLGSYPKVADFFGKKGE
jgi:hypothetical protein